MTEEFCNCVTKLIKVGGIRGVFRSMRRSKCDSATSTLYRFRMQKVKGQETKSE